jgi:F-type H+-transporting ATPase subunit a
MLASTDILDHVMDHPWPGTDTLFGVRFTWMSSAIATMILVGLLLAVLLPMLARRHARLGIKSLSGQVIEVIVLFVRDQIAVPALGQKRAYTFLPFLLTMFVFVLAMNLIGLLPLQPLTMWLTDGHYPVGHTPTSLITVCAALAGTALLVIFFTGCVHAVRHSKLPLWAAAPLAPGLWFLNLSPSIPGVTGMLLKVPLAILEIIGVVAKCFSLMIRLFANMVAGHILLAVLMMFIVMTLETTVTTAMDATVENDIVAFYVGPVCVAGSVLVDLMELLVAGLQAYILTFLTAMFLGLYGEPAH